MSHYPLNYPLNYLLNKPEMANKQKGQGKARIGRLLKDERRAEIRSRNKEEFGEYWVEGRVTVSK